MKKVTLLILTFGLLLLLCSCGHTHEFGEWATTTDATCVTDGVKERNCECGETETETIAAVGHIFDQWTVISEPTCTEDGSKERVCECGEKETEILPAIGHTFGEAIELSAATCTDAGKSEKTCKTCGSATTEEIPATGHSFTPATNYYPKMCTVCWATEGEALSKVIAYGDYIESENHSFSIESIKFTGSLSDKRGSITYKHSSNFALAIKLSFTNLATEAFERWNSERITDISLEYRGKYNYEGEYWIPADDIVPLGTDALYIVFEVPESMENDTTGAIMCTFTVDGEAYSVIIQTGEWATEDQAASAETAADVSGDIALGDTATNGTSFSFVLSDLYYTSKPSYKVGSVTYSYGNDGYYFVCLLDYTNLSTEAVTDWNSELITDMQLSFADKYTYEATCWIPNDEIVPLDTGKLFIVAEVPETVETSTDPLVLTFTVDKNTFTVNCR